MLNVKKRQYPNGWHTIKATLDDFEIDIYIYDMYYTRKIISKELFEYWLENDIADKNLIDEWKNKGQENLCCLRCIPTRESRLDTICNCRVPKSKLEAG
ncbi:hypothetical protein ACJMK2_003579 [Sinanodonta woodiana]|uniref:Uncharacterized protein n=1 Tax=Sinanodonta woodiana TaxID=1069815 RepID=A0ABD3XYM5_SINWO